MMLILFGLVAVFLPPFSCSTCLNGNFTRSITVEVGASMQLKCHDGGETNATIEWHREPFPNSTYQNIYLPNGEKIYYGNVLKFPRITRHQSGIYICSVDNQCGWYFRVKVHFKPIILETYRIRRFEGKELELRCNAEGEPPAEVLWTRHSTIKKFSSSFNMGIDREFDDTLNSTFMISEYDFSNDLSTYKCEFTNPLGTAVAHFDAISI